MLPKRKRLHLEDFDYSDPNMVYSITLCAYGRKPYFLNENIVKSVLNEIDFRIKCSKEVAVFTHCIMPDHLHLLLKLKEGYGKSLQNWVTAFKRYIAREVNEIFRIKPLWQNNFYEHIVRKEESLHKIAEYIVNNPVRKGLVDDWRKYPDSKIDFTDC